MTDAAPGGWAVSVRDLTKRYGARTVVDHIALDLAPGRICGFLGPNGSGKTTTLRMICGLLIPDAGGGTVLGLDLRRDRLQIKAQIGYMTQRFGLFEDLTIRENLRFVADVHGLDQPRDAVAAALDRLGLATRADQLAGSLSGGWKQRLALAACVLHRPRILLLDEPTAGVDPQARRDFWDQIHALAADGVTVLVSTHYMDEAERCHDIAYIAYGAMLARGTAAEIIAASGLFALTGTGPDADRLAHALQRQPGIDTAAAFGATIHVCGRDRAALRAAVAGYPALRWVDAEPTLEDVFIDLMRTTPDNSVAAVAA
ncbi:MAG: ABC transporter ATP-binding protein, partial [Polymorphobacter sp.]